jgi:hypothetical protein
MNRFDLPVTQTQLAVMLARVIPGSELNDFQTAKLAKKLVKLSTEHKKIQQGLEDYPEKSEPWEQAETHIEREIKKLLKPLNIKVSFSGDPNGGTVRLRLVAGDNTDILPTNID